jgi:undecaprenyl-diphosphatase
VIALYPARCKQVLDGVFGRDREGMALGLHLLVAFSPAAIMGLLVGDLIPEELSSVAWAWMGGGVLMLVLARKLRPEAGGAGVNLLSFSGALGIGIFQCLAFLPGTSRSLATIVGGVLVGLSVAAAVEFSFLLGLVTILAACVYKGWGARELLFESYSAGDMLVGILAAFVSAALTMRWLVSWVKTRGLDVFGWYRLALGVGVLIWLEASS